MQDRYADPKKAVQRLLADEEFPTDDVQRIELGFQANGEVSCRIWRSKQEEAVILVLAGDT